MMWSKGHLESYEEDRLMPLCAYEFILVFMTLSRTSPGRLVAGAAKILKVPHTI